MTAATHRRPCPPIDPALPVPHHRADLRPETRPRRIRRSSALRDVAVVASIASMLLAGALLTSLATTDDAACERYGSCAAAALVMLGHP